MTSTIIMVIVIAALNAAAAIYKEHAKRKAAAAERAPAARGGSVPPRVPQATATIERQRAAVRQPPAVREAPRATAGGPMGAERPAGRAPATRSLLKSKPTMKPRGGWPGASNPRANALKPPPLPPKPSLTGSAGLSVAAGAGKARLEAIVQSVMDRLAPSQRTDSAAPRLSGAGMGVRPLARKKPQSPRSGRSAGAMSIADIRRAVAISVILETPRAVRPWAPPAIDE